MSLILVSGLYAQNIGINEDGSTPDASAILDIKASNKGVLMPRLTSSQRGLIPSPAEGLMVYDTDTESFWFHNGSQWEEGNGKDGEWTVNGADVYRAAGNVGVGTNSPNNKLHLKEDSPGPLAIQFNGQYEPPVNGSRTSSNNIGTSVNSSVAASWTGVSNAAAATGGNFWTGGLVGDNERSDFLNIRFSSLSASLPLNATITGYLLTLRKRASDFNDIYDYSIRLMNGTVPLGLNRANPSAPWITSFSTIFYGSSTDTWGTNIPITQINAGQLGVQIEYVGEIATFSGDEQ
ncbi:MAG: hypothetical protein O2867_07045, partial [Bacteroidetes bacterium]|nr:hypothetical protein [Bacteroidota bacterium]